MSQHQAQDTSLWNKLLYGKPRMPNLEDDIEKGVLEEEFYNEKQAYSDDKNISNEYSEPIIVEQSKIKGLKRYGIILIGLVLSIFFLKDHLDVSKILRFHHCHGAIERESLRAASFVDESLGILNAAHFNGTAPARQVIDVANPNVPRHSYGKPVYSTNLVKHTFGHSWGIPAIANYTPPSDIQFNRVVLTLNTSVDGVQYDRLANVFVNGIEIWRTSTAEPGGGAVYSTVKKDVSSYMKLFTEKSKVLFQLDNILSGRLIGKFEVELFADFYNVEEHQPDANAFLNEEDKSLTHSIFSVAKPASQVYALSNKKDTDASPISYLPSDRLVINVRSVPINTTRLRLSIFTSGNGAEEFWYANVLDKYVRKFEKHGRALQGHGPVRVVNVYFNGEKIATQSPQPIIFSGGVSPALWSSVMPINSFDLPSIDLDISGILPFLWENQSIEDKNIEIEIENGLDEVNKPEVPRSSIGENWITSANLLTYESNEIADVSGDIVKIVHDHQTSVIDFAPPYSGSIEQTITGSFSAELTSNLNFILKDGSVLNTTVSSISEAKISNIQSYRQYGDSQKLVHIGSSTKLFTILNVNSSENEKPKNDNIIHNYKTLLNYPLTISLEEGDKSAPHGTDLEYNAKIVHAKESTVNVDGKNFMSAMTTQNGDSTYMLSHKGNHGFGNLKTKYNLIIHTPSGNHNYKRKVKAVNGTITADKSKTDTEDHDDLKFYQLHYKVLPGKLYKKLKVNRLEEEYDNVAEALLHLSKFESSNKFICKELRDILNQMNIFDIHGEFIIMDENMNTLEIIRGEHRGVKGKHHGSNGKHHDDERPLRAFRGKHHDEDKRRFRGKHHDSKGRHHDDKERHFRGKHHDGKGRHHDDEERHFRGKHHDGKGRHHDDEERHFRGKHHDGKGRHHDGRGKTF